MTELPFTIDIDNFEICFNTGEVYTIDSSKRGSVNYLPTLKRLVVHKKNKMIQTKMDAACKSIQFIYFDDSTFTLNHVVTMTYDDIYVTCNCTYFDNANLMYLCLQFDKQFLLK